MGARERACARLPAAIRAAPRVAPPRWPRVAARREARPEPARVGVGWWRMGGVLAERQNQPCAPWGAGAGRNDTFGYKRGVRPRLCTGHHRWGGRACESAAGVRCGRRFYIGIHRVTVGGQRDSGAWGGCGAGRASRGRARLPWGRARTFYQESSSGERERGQREGTGREGWGRGPRARRACARSSDRARPRDHLAGATVCEQQRHAALLLLALMSTRACPRGCRPRHRPAARPRARARRGASSAGSSPP